MKLQELITSGKMWVAEPSDEDTPQTAPAVASSIPRRRLIESCAEQYRYVQKLESLPLGIQEIDDLLPHGGLPFGHTHEWCAVDSDGKNYPPLTIIAAMLGRAYNNPLNRERYVLWLGEKLWPTPYLLSQCGGDLLIEQSRFISLSKKDTRAWALVQSLSSSAVLAVVGAVQDIPLSYSKKLAYAAARGSTLGIFIKDHEGISKPSASLTKWCVTSQITSPHEEVSSWSLSLLHHKGSSLNKKNWTITASHGTAYETISLALSPHMVNGYRRAASL